MSVKIQLVSNESQSCDSCGGCGASGRPEPSTPVEGQLGSNTALTALAMFLLPIILATTGAIVLRQTATTQAVGALCGAVIGVMIARRLLHVGSPKETRHVQ